MVTVNLKTAAGLLACAVASLGGAGAGHLLTEDPSCAGVGAVHGQDKCKWIGWPSRHASCSTGCGVSEGGGCCAAACCAEAQSPGGPPPPAAHNHDGDASSDHRRGAAHCAAFSLADRHMAPAPIGAMPPCATDAALDGGQRCGVRCAPGFRATAGASPTCTSVACLRSVKALLRCPLSGDQPATGLVCEGDAESATGAESAADAEESMGDDADDPHSPSSHGPERRDAAHQGGGAGAGAGGGGAVGAGPSPPSSIPLPTAQATQDGDLNIIIVGHDGDPKSDAAGETSGPSEWQMILAAACLITLSAATVLKRKAQHPADAEASRRGQDRRLESGSVEMEMHLLETGAAGGEPAPAPMPLMAVSAHEVPLTHSFDGDLSDLEIGGLPPPPLDASPSEDALADLPWSFDLGLDVDSDSASATDGGSGYSSDEPATAPPELYATEVGMGMGGAAMSMGGGMALGVGEPSICLPCDSLPEPGSAPSGLSGGSAGPSAAAAGQQKAPADRPRARGGGRSKGPKAVKCPVAGCNYMAPSRAHMTRHQRTHSGEKPFACPHPGCSYRAAQREHLKTHAVKHSNLKPFKCEICGFATKRKEHLTRHMQRHR